jgi:hypothetical protein
LHNAYGKDRIHFVSPHLTHDNASTWFPKFHDSFSIFIIKEHPTAGEKKAWKREFAMVQNNTQITRAVTLAPGASVPWGSARVIPVLLRDAMFGGIDADWVISDHSENLA